MSQINSINNNFNLGERSINIVVKNGSRQDPENTIFKLNDTYHRWTYFIRDFLDIWKDWIDLQFNNLHCNYNVNIKINPDIYIKYISIIYWYNQNWECIYKVTPKEYARLTTVKIEEKFPLLEYIKLNDLSILNYISFFVFWLFLMIYLWIIYIEKHRILVYNNKNINT